MNAPNGPRKLKVATASLAGCFGCHMSLLDIDPAFLPPSPAVAEPAEAELARAASSRAAVSSTANGQRTGLPNFPFACVICSPRSFLTEWRVLTSPFERCIGS